MIYLLMFNIVIYPILASLLYAPTNGYRFYKTISVANPVYLHNSDQTE